MIPVRTFSDRLVGVFGLARSGLAAVRALREGGASVIAYDDRQQACQEAELVGAQIADFEDWPWDRIAALVLSPGVPLTHPLPHDIVVRAREAQVPIIGDIDLFGQVIDTLATDEEGARRRPPVAAITGTNGKSTTTALLGHLLQRTGLSAQIGGNIGKPVLELDPPIEASAYVLEISSYQIDLTHNLKPKVAALLNITPDHLDRHGTLENYAAVKGRLLSMVGKSGTAVISVDDPLSERIFTDMWARNGRRIVPVSVGKALGFGVFVLDGILYDGMGSPAVEVEDLRKIPSLQGEHNWQNAAIAYACAEALGREREHIARAMHSFPGLAHRMERLGDVQDVLFVNDSKATNAEAAARALAVYDPIFWIVGGVAKDGGIKTLKEYMPRVAQAYLIGESAAVFAKDLDAWGVKYEICETLDRATRAAFDGAVASGHDNATVLLSPACASFDQYPNFEVRGDAFRAAVADLKGQPGLAEETQDCRRGQRMSLWSRSDRSLLSRWWWTVDHTSLAIVLALLGLGFALLLASSPAIAEGHNLSRYHFVQRQMVFAGPALALLLGLSLIPLERLKHLAIALLGMTFVGVLATHLVAPDIKGAQRWIHIGSFALQPSEFLKPAFVVTCAWILSERSPLAPAHKYIAATVLAAICVTPIALQPDFGQTALLLSIWGALMFLAGLPTIWMALMAGIAVAGSVFVYQRVDHVADRINGYINPATADTYQVDLAMRAFHAGGWSGQGMGEGALKSRIPDAHTDFIFAVAGEEYGFFVCLLIVVLFAGFVVRGLMCAMREPDHFIQLAGAGCVLLLGLQAFINLGVNIQLLPAKGMTLPFISYGGSSLLSSAIVAGLVLACTRRRVHGGLPLHLRHLGRAV